MKRIVLLGATGSIGTQVLDVVRRAPEQFQIIGLSAHDNLPLLDSLVREFHPPHVLETSLSENPTAALETLASLPEADLIINAISGSAGLMPTLAACRAGKKIALANKESLVMAGELVIKTAREHKAQIIPIDSEPAALWDILRCKCLHHRGVQEWEQNQDAIPCRRSEISKVVLTASGGPFWKWRLPELAKVTAKEAVRHPTWQMGEKVSVDSATLMNKAFEIIETHWLFEIPAEKIEVTVHRQSIVHAMVEWRDGSLSTAMSAPDMHIPIAQALFYPAPSPMKHRILDTKKLSLSFEAPDYSVFEGPQLAYEVLSQGGLLPAVFCLADEVAVRRFLVGEISFLDIYPFIKDVLGRFKNMSMNVEALRELIDNASV